MQRELLLSLFGNTSDRLVGLMTLITEHYDGYMRQ
jgi:hypothetical protein